MDIPRGTFSSIRRDALLSDVLADLRKTSFTGYATVGCSEGSVSLVFLEGTCILAEYGDLHGRTAWQEIQELGGEKVEAGLYLLTPQQIKLASEFNKSAAIPVSSAPPRSERREEEHAAAAAPRSAAKNRAGAGQFRLPRGSFCEIRHNLPAGDVIADMEKTRFSGYGVFSGDFDTFTLVFSGGVCILASGNGGRGSATLDAAKTVENVFEVGLYALSGQQVSLALEFNEGYRIRPASTGRRSSGNITAQSSVAAPRPVPASRVSPSPPPPPPKVQERPVVKPGRPAPASKQDSAQDSAQDPTIVALEQLDEIDPAAMAANLKSSYVSILDHLQLGHLVDRKKGKEV